MCSELIQENINIENIIDKIKADINASNLSVTEQYLLTPYYKRCIDEYSNYSKIVLVGAGNYGRRLYEMLELEHIEKSVVSFADNSSLRQGTMWNGLRSISVNEAVKEFPDAYYVITPKDYGVEIFRQLLGMGIMPDKITIFNFANSGMID